MRAFSRLFAVLIFLAAATAATAQQNSWIQVEAQPGRNLALESASSYAQRVQNVGGFRLGRSSWYAVVLGPYEDRAARTLAAQLRAQGVIPDDAFVTLGENHGERFWPIGAATTVDDSVTLQTPAIDTAELGGDDSATAATTDTVTDTATDTAAANADPIVAPEPVEEPDETPAEARRSESLLTRDQKKQLQIALQWAGFYDKGIDGSFGRGTRASMRAWQESKGHDTSGVLTTRQRQELLDDYNAVLTELGVALVTDMTAGIEIMLPTALVSLEKYEPPFAQYNAAGGDDLHRVILISQRGNRNTLYGLYDIMQTLEIVPPEGPRRKRDLNFTLVGQNDRFISHTEAVLNNGQVKGFTLIWPVDDEERRTRLLAEMRASFTSLSGIVMEDSIGTDGANQHIDLVSGLRLRRANMSRSGFYVDATGSVLTTTDVTGQQCKRLTLNDTVVADVQASDDASGLVLLTPREPLEPIDFARFQPEIPRLQSEVAVAGFPFEGVLGLPSLTYGKLADIRGLGGETGIDRLDLSPQPGDAGGPVLDNAGSVMGMLLPRRRPDGRILPDHVAFAADAEAIAAFLGAAGVVTEPSDRARQLGTEELTLLAAHMTVLVSCWN